MIKRGRDVFTFSANLGFLWTDRPLSEGIRLAAEAGFDAVECHEPYAAAESHVSAALRETNMVMTSLNTPSRDAGVPLGLAAVPGEEARARGHIDQAIAYAAAIGCANVSVLAGCTGRRSGSEDTYRANLAYAATAAAKHGIGVLIEPLNSKAAPGYHLTMVEDGMATIDAVGHDNVKLMIDCFHTHMMEGDLMSRFDQAIAYVGHVQISAYPDRGEPIGGEIDYLALLPALRAFGYTGSFGAEYTPRGTVEEGLGWLSAWRTPREGSA